MKHLSGAPCAPLQGRLLALPANIRLGWRCLPVTNTSLLLKFVSYGLKSFIGLGPVEKKVLQDWSENVFVLDGFQSFPALRVTDCLKLFLSYFINKLVRLTLEKYLHPCLTFTRMSERRRAQCYKTFYICNLWLLEISQSVQPQQAFPNQCNVYRLG